MHKICEGYVTVYCLKFYVSLNLSEIMKNFKQENDGRRYWNLQFKQI